MDPSGIVRAISIPASLLFDVSSMFRIHPFKRLRCGGGPGVNLTMKSAKAYPLIIVLDSNVTLTGLISVTHFAILPVASRFFTIVLKGYSVSIMIGKN